MEPSLIRNECLHHIFEETVDTHPHNTAILFDSTAITYREVEAQANAMARYLRSLGVSKSSCVGLYIPKSIDLYISMLAIMKAGAAYVPIDTGYPADRVLYILKDCGIKVLISTSNLLQQIPYRGFTVNLDSDKARILSFPITRLSSAETEVATHDLAYVMYTSGTTGRPKGVMIEHRSICHLVRASQMIFGITAQDRIYQGFSVAFDFSLDEIWMAFSNGAVLIPATPEMESAGPKLSELLTKAKITAMGCVPTLLSILEDDIPSLRLLDMGGEDFPYYLINKWWKPGRRIFNTYGPTETTVTATYSECMPQKPITIGRPLSNSTIYILDENLHPVAQGESGKIYIGGVGLSRGYINNPEMTRKHFIPNPFATNDQDSARLYRSGDLARFNEQGEIVFLGRADTQVKIRGFRIELSEIESILATAPDVKTAVASVYEKSPGIQSIAAYIVSNDGGEPDIKTLRNKLHDRLPSYMIPEFIEMIPEVPLMPTGKVDRKKLPHPRTPLAHR